MSQKGWVTVELPESTMIRVDRFFQERYSRRPGKVPIGLVLAELVETSLRRVELASKYDASLEEYAIENDGVFIKDNRTEEIVKVIIAGRDLQCSRDATDNCVHVGYALSLPQVYEIRARTKQASD